MKNINEDFVWPTKNKIINNAFKYSHDSKNVIAVFWFNMLYHEIKITLRSIAQHTDKDIIPDNPDSSWIRGRVLKHSGHNILAYYGTDDRALTKSTLRHLISELQRLLRLDISTAIDYDGFEMEK